MPDFTSLLSQSPDSHSDRTDTLNCTLEEACRVKGERLTDANLARIVEGFRTQCTRWNAEQQQQSRKRVPSKKVELPKELPPGLQLKITKPTI